MEAKREFAYEKFRRDIQTCSDVKELQELACKFLRLYFGQQELVESLISKGWLPPSAAG